MNKASDDMSKAVISAVECLAKEMGMHPLPVPISTAFVKLC